MRVLLLALSFGLLAGDARADWTRLRSANFTFVGDASERQIRRVAQQLEQFREVMVRVLPEASVGSPAPIVVIAMRPPVAASAAPRPTARATHARPRARDELVTVTNQLQAERLQLETELTRARAEVKALEFQLHG